MKTNELNRRRFIEITGTAALAAAASPLTRLAAESPSNDSLPRGKADSCIFIWLGGGAAQVDTFDPKGRGDGRKVPGCYYDAIPTAIPGVQVCEHLHRTAPLLDRCVLVRSLTHDIVSEHGAATNLVHTGRKPDETVVYPSIGSIVSRQLGPKSDTVPPYVVMGYPNIARDPGFLGPQYGYVYLTQVETGPNGFVRPPDIDAQRQQRREQLLSLWHSELAQRQPRDEKLRAQIEVSEQGFRMAGPEFMRAFELGQEPLSLRETYGGEFGQRCLLARRLVQSGVRFIEVSFNLNFLNGTGWDTHNDGQINQHLLIQDLDRAFSALLVDLEKNGILDSTLVVIATEFGRPPEFDSGGGRGHQSTAFTGVLAGGGLRLGRVIGETDELSKRIVDRPVTIPDFHATIHCALGINPSHRLMADDRPVPLTDHGKPIRDLFS